MFEIVVIISCAITLILLKIFLDINLKNIKGMEKRNSSELESLSLTFPSDEQMCKDILKKLKNDKEVKIKVDEEYNSCVYTIFDNTITIGKFKRNYMKVQTIAHECVHSCQNKKTLWSNFIFTNIYLIYFVLIVILEIFNVLPYANIHTIILIFLGIVQYIIRFSLENEAMIKARFIAKEYIEENRILDEEEKDKLLSEYDEVNNIGITFMNFHLISKNIMKDLIYALIVLL